MGQQLNIGYACTRHQCENGLGNNTALIWVGADGDVTKYTYTDIDESSNKTAAGLLNLGLVRGDTLAIFLPRCPELYIAFLGALKAGIRVLPLFHTFGSEALLDRLQDSGAQALLTRSRSLRKISKIQANLPNLRHVISVDDGGQLPSGTVDYACCQQFRECDPCLPSVLHYTSGSTGKPKGVIHVHESIEHLVETAKTVFRLGPGSLYWCTADPAWVTGTSYGIIGPWAVGATQVQFEGGYDAKAWMSILEQQKPQVWYTAPTALRMLMQESEDLYRDRDFSTLHSIFSVGEPLDPETIAWGRKVFHRDIYDTWFQTETGGVMICNRPQLPVKPGSMGKPVEGIVAAVVDDDFEASACGTVGKLAIKAGWSSMFKGYLGKTDRWDGRVGKDKAGVVWYQTGDLARTDEEGYFWFVGRSDDVINTAGHLVGPFEVESALLELPEVAESAVVGVPHPVLHEKVLAFVVLCPGHDLTDELKLKMCIHVSNKVSSIANPQDIVRVDEIPKTNSGKLLRRVLRDRYLLS